MHRDACVDVSEAIHQIVKRRSWNEGDTKDKRDEAGAADQATHGGRTEAKPGGESLCTPNGDRRQGQDEQAIAEPVQRVIQGQRGERRSLRMEHVLDADGGERQHERQAQRVAST